MNMNKSILEEPLIHLRIWIRNDDVMNEEYDEAKGSRRSLPTKKIDTSIQLSFHCYAFVYIQLMCYACLSIFIYTIELHMMGKKSMMLNIIPLLLI